MVKLRKVPQRMCVGCREMKEKKQLIRIVRNPEGEVAVDVTGKKSGRGAYICPDIDCLEKAIKNKGIQKALQTEISSEILNDIKVKLS
jgi:predicted RNA-binding protein YlxR (DUF448 family)